MNTDKLKSLGKYCDIHPSVEFGDNVVVGNYCEILSGCKIGNNVVIQSRIRMAYDCVIEDNVILKCGTILTSKVHVKKGAFIGPNCITFGAKFKEDGVMVEHGTVIGEDCILGGGTHIKANTSVCDNVITGSHAYVNKDITEPGTYVGVPVRKIFASDGCGPCHRCRKEMVNENTKCPVSTICDQCSQEINDNKKNGIEVMQCPHCFYLQDSKLPFPESVKCNHCYREFNPSNPFGWDDDSVKKE